MTSRTRNFIELADLIGLHMECDNCDATLTAPLNKQDRDMPENCPNCGHRWGSKPAPNGKQTKEYVAEFAVHLRALQVEMAGDSRGFMLTFEVSSPASNGQD
jgi:DNA-directed RNA polymerase subunit RPC12/RpoP